MSIPREQITGLVLAGGRGSRMGGVDKGLQPWRGQPLVQHALQRLRPQVGRLMINANRNLDAYAALGAPVWPDAVTGFPGPLGGFLAGLAHCPTAFMVTVPCDSPVFPSDLVARLAAAAEAAGADMALAASTEADGRVQPQPVFCLLRTSLHGALEAAMAAGERKIDRWAERHRCVTVTFDDAAAFFNANTLDDLRG